MYKKFIEYLKDNHHFDFDIIDYVTKKHGNQKYGDGHPYIYHILNVKDISEKYINLYNWSEKDKHIIRTSILCHDILEDTETDDYELVSLFGKEVWEIVFNVSGFGKNRKERNEDAYNKIIRDDKSIFVKLCDRISNVEESMTNRSKFRMYKNEYPEFRNKIFNGKFIEMWDYLEKLIYEN